MDESHSHCEPVGTGACTAPRGNRVASRPTGGVAGNAACHPRRRGRCPGVSTPEGERVFTLQGGEHPYRALIEQMREGAATLTPEGVIHYCNRRFAEMLKLPLERVMGGRMEDFVAPADRAPAGRDAQRGRRAGGVGPHGWRRHGGAGAGVGHLCCGPKARPPFAWSSPT